MIDRIVWLIMKPVDWLHNRTCPCRLTNEETRK